MQAERVYDWNDEEDDAALLEDDDAALVEESNVGHRTRHKRRDDTAVAGSHKRRRHEQEERQEVEEQDAEDDDDAVESGDEVGEERNSRSRERGRHEKGGKQRSRRSVEVDGEGGEDEEGDDQEAGGVDYTVHDEGAALVRRMESWDAERIIQYVRENPGEVVEYAISLLLKEGFPVSTAIEDVTRTSTLVAFFTSRMAQTQHRSAGIFSEESFLRCVTVPCSVPELEDDAGTAVIDYSLVAPLAAKYFRSATISSFIFGPHERDIPQRATRAAPRRSDLSRGEADVVGRAENVDTATRTDSQIADMVRGALLSVGKSPLLKFVVNPHSLTQTVENLFAVSLLVNKGHVAVCEEDDDTYIYVVDKSQFNKANNKQFILNMTKAYFEKCIEVYNITQPLVPNRT